MELHIIEISIVIAYRNFDFPFLYVAIATLTVEIVD